MTRRKLQVQYCVVAYSISMFAVDRFDKIRSTNTIMRREKRVSMSIFTYLLDASLQNAYTVLQSIVVPGEVTYTAREFKRTVASQLVQPLIDRNCRRYTISNVTRAEIPLENINFTSSNSMENNILLETVDRKTTSCHLCKIAGKYLKSKWTIYACQDCQTGLQVNCFAFYHKRAKKKLRGSKIHSEFIQLESNIKKRE